MTISTHFADPEKSLGVSELSPTYRTPDKVRVPPRAPINSPMFSRMRLAFQYLARVGTVWVLSKGLKITYYEKSQFFKITKSGLCDFHNMDFAPDFIGRNGDLKNDAL